MKHITLALILVSTMISSQLLAQDGEIQTVFRGSRGSGGYGALSNKFTTINGEYANMAEIYGGWFINKRFLLGVGGAAVTNNLRVPQQYRTLPDVDMSYEYGQFGLVTEYVFGSNKAFHVNFTMMTGAGFTVQYIRHHWDDYRDDYYNDYNHDENFFFVMEPGVQLEVNILKWMRFSPGVSYRRTFGSDARGLSDTDLSNVSYNLTLKFGKF
jgi:hypothetical protein